MSRVIFEENYKVRYLPAVSNKAAPTLLEWNAGTELTTFVTKDGVNQGVTNNRVNANDIATSFDAELMGSQGVQLSLTFFLDSGTDTPRTTLMTYRTTGFIGIAPFGYSGSGGTAPAVGDKVHIYPMQTGNPNFPASAANEAQKWTCEMAVTSQPKWFVALT